MKLTPFNKLTGDWDLDSIFRAALWVNRTWDPGVGDSVCMRMETYEALRKELNRLRKAAGKGTP